MNDPDFVKNLQKKVFQPGFAQPTMTLEEFADGEIRNMNLMQEQQAQMDKLAKIEEEKDPDRDEALNEQIYKDRNWDDWKDNHEKGAGNKMGR